MANPTSQDYVMDVLIRQYCKTAEENDILYEEMNDLRNALKLLFTENADLRWHLKEAGITVAPSEFVTINDDNETEEIGVELNENLTE